VVYDIFIVLGIVIGLESCCHLTLRLLRDVTRVTIIFYFAKSSITSLYFVSLGKIVQRRDGEREREREILVCSHFLL